MFVPYLCLFIVSVLFTMPTTVGMNCLRPLECRGPGLESLSRHECMCEFIHFMLPSVLVAALRRADPTSKESYRLCPRVGLRS
jgi:hypothetical protein